MALFVGADGGGVGWDSKEVVPGLPLWVAREEKWRVAFAFLAGLLDPREGLG